MQRLEVSGAVRPLYGSLGVKGLTHRNIHMISCLRETSSGAMMLVRILPLQRHVFGNLLLNLFMSVLQKYIFFSLI